MKLNLGCGASRLPDFVNIDIDASVEPDQVFDFTGKFPYDDNSVDEVVCYHTLEHIPKWKHEFIFDEVFRVLIPDGVFRIAFPEFLICAENWKNNYKGKREFWEATIFGRQSSPHDFHVCIMSRRDLALQLIGHGFIIDYDGTEPIEDFNSLIICRKDQKTTYEEALLASIGG